MVNVTFSRNEDTITITADGHATGDPLICTATSILLSQFLPWAHFNLQPGTYRIHEGYGKFRATLPADKAMEQADFVSAGLSRLVSNAPDKIKVNIV